MFMAKSPPMNILSFTSPITTSDSKNSSRVKGKERTIVEREINNFDPKSSPAWSALKEQFSSGIRHPELLSIAYIVSKLTNVPEISRTSKRSFVCLIKWFNDNWDKIAPVIGRITLLDEHNQQISGHRELIDFCRS